MSLNAVTRVMFPHHRLEWPLDPEPTMGPSTHSIHHMLDTGL